MELDLLNRGWRCLSFDDITLSLRRGPFGSNLKKSCFVSSGYKVYEQQHAINDDYTLGTYYIDEEKYEELRSFAVNPGDYIVSCSGTIGKLSKLPKEAPKGIINQALLKITLNDNILDHKYFVCLFRSQQFLKNILKDARGTGIQNLAGITELRTVSVAVPPLPEQRAIASKIEQLFSELDNGIANLRLAQEQLKVYRQAVLKKAFEGELTRKWREQQTDLPDARDLLEQISKEREEAAKSSGKKVKPVKPLTEDEIAKLTGLPEGWGWVKLGDLVEEPKYGTSKKCDYNIKGTGVLRIPNIGNGVINHSDLKYAQFYSTEIESYQLREGDILTIRSNGSVDLVGKCALVGIKDEKYLYAGYLIKLRPLSSLIDSKYLLNCLSSIDLRNQIELKTKSTSGVNNINSGELQSLIIPLCSLPEQHAIVEEIETRLSVCDKMAQDIDEALEKAEALRQSILKKAFEGKLLSERELAEVRMAKDWEPADLLLERIRAERVGNGKN